MNIESIKKEIQEKLNQLIKIGLETEVTLIKKQGDTEQLGISDIGERTLSEEYLIKIINMTRASDKNAVGEIQNSMKLGDNPDTYFEFIKIPIFSNEKTEEIKIDVGNRIRYQQEEYIIFECIPIVLENVVLLHQYTAKKAI